MIGPWLACLSSVALLTQVHGGRAADVPRIERAAEGTLTVFTGSVLTPRGAPAAGAVVVSSAGGKAVADRDGRYRLEARVPLEAVAVQITAVAAGGGLRASARVDVSAGTGALAAPPLALARGGACQPTWLPTFGGQPGTDGEVRALAVFDDGGGPALYAGGTFLVAGGLPASRLARWDGSAWAEVGGGVNGAVNALLVHDDGGGPALYVGGSFTSAGGVPANRIARWDGAAWSALGSGVSGGGQVRVNALVAHDDGGGPALYAGGRFLLAGGAAAGSIARWDGAAWSALASGMDDDVLSLAVHDEGGGPELYAGGEFVTAGGVTVNRVARWDGASWAALGGGLSGTPGLEGVNALVSFDDGGGAALHAGGEFAAAGGLRNFTRWNGTSWDVLPSLNGRVRALALHDDGSGPGLVAAGEFRSTVVPGGNYVMRWDGTGWSAFDGGIDGEFPGSHAGALAVLAAPGPDVVCVGGDFHGASGVAANHVARWTGLAWTGLGHGLNGAVDTLASHDDGGGAALFAGGFFASAGQVGLGRIGKWGESGWEGLDGGVDGPFPHAVHALAEYDDGGGAALHAGGQFQSAGGTTVGHVARWDGAAWSDLAGGLAGPALEEVVSALAAHDDGSGPALFVGGDFTLGPGQNAARWNGASWTALGAGTNGPVFALAVFDDGGGPALYAAGRFSSAGGVSAANVARWDGAAWSALGAGLSGEVHALAVHDDGGGAALFAGGSFSSAGGAPASRIARWNGTSWSALGSGLNDTVHALAVHDDGGGPALYAGGFFTTAGGLAANRIARWDGAGWSALGSGMSGAVRALAVHDDGDGPALYAGGTFASAPDAGDSFLARWRCPPDTTPPVLSAPAAVTVTDRLASAPGEIVAFEVSASDDRDPAPAVVCVPPSGSWFPEGTSLVQCTATDAAGNQAFHEIEIRVLPRVRSRQR